MSDSSSSSQDTSSSSSKTVPKQSTGGSTILPGRYTSGPLGLGDPEDRSLRRVETEVLIPKMVRERAKKEVDKCGALKGEFDDCTLRHGFMMVAYCRDENRRFMACMNDWFHRAEFVAECREQYLAKRAEFRRTGKKETMKRMEK